MSQLSSRDPGKKCVRLVCATTAWILAIPHSVRRQANWTCIQTDAASSTEFHRLSAVVQKWGLQHGGSPHAVTALPGRKCILSSSACTPRNIGSTSRRPRVRDLGEASRVLSAYLRKDPGRAVPEGSFRGGVLPLEGQNGEPSRLARHILPVAEQRFDPSTLLAISALDSRSGLTPSMAWAVSHRVSFLNGDLEHRLGVHPRPAAWNRSPLPPASTWTVSVHLA
jgi:hypothetical protein